ncbi:MAG: hypothetical protein HXS46_03360 [Theionarchaea archaeon]|nr:MAG: hypothetical protein AYK18_07595 [Theionarchaea archaeon DG-70]MBU7009701.1 hypothetical protein [Theionarchaea archaeon]
MLEEPDTDTEQVVYCMVKGFHKTLFEDTLRFVREIIPNQHNVDLLLNKMDREIFADFRKSLDSSLMKDSQITILFSL